MALFQNLIGSAKAQSVKLNGLRCFGTMTTLGQPSASSASSHHILCSQSTWLNLNKFHFNPCVSRRLLELSVLRGTRYQLLTTSNDTISPEPSKTTRYGMMKVLLTIILGLYVGAAISWTMAAWLEENELFSVEEEDD